MPSRKPVYRFDSVTVDVSNVRVTVSGQTQPLEPKSFRLLQFLIENRGRVVAKEELLQSIWPDTHVTDNALTRAVAQVRKALADDSRNPRYLETVPTVGYRFLGSVEVMPVLAEPPTAAAQVEPPTAEAQVEPPMAAAAAEPAKTVTRARPGIPLAWVAGVLLVFGVAAGIALWFRRVAVPVAGHLLSNRQFTGSTGLDVCATFSPNGNLVAYASDRSGAFQIYIRSLVPGAREVKLTSGPGQNLYPSFSPDGGIIVFSQLEGHGIFRVPVTGGAASRLTDFGAEPVWSPDGKWVVFRSSSALSLSTTDHYFPATSSLWLMEADGRGLREITGPKSPAGGQAFASWSPDSSEVRFANYNNERNEMWSYRIANGALRELFGSRGMGFGSAIFSRDDRFLFYVSAQLNGDIGIWEQRLHPRDLSPDGAPRPLFQPSVGVPRDLALSRDGKQLLYSAVTPDSRIQILHLGGDSAGNDEARGPKILTRDVTYRYTQPRWAPDDRKLVFLTLQKGRPPQVTLATYPDGDQADLPLSDDPHFYPMVPARGSSLFYVSRTREQGVFLGRMELPDGVPQVVRRLPDNANQTSLSPDGSELAFHMVRDHATNLWLLNLGTGALKQLTFGKIVTGYPQFSRSGRFLCFQRQNGAHSEIAVMPVEGPEPAGPLAQGVLFAFSWSPDDSKIAYAGLEGGIWNLYWISRATKERQQLTHNTSSRVYFRYPDWSHDGTKIAYEFHESKGNVYLAQIE